MLDWKFSQVFDEYYDTIFGMCYDVTHDAEAARIAVLDCFMEVAAHMKPRHSYDDVVFLTILSCINFILRRWHENPLEHFSLPIIKVDKKDFLY